MRKVRISLRICEKGIRKLEFTRIGKTEPLLFWPSILSSIRRHQILTDEYENRKGEGMIIKNMLFIGSK